jgi:hypothetical protein
MENYMLIIIGILLTLFLIIKFADRKSQMEVKSKNNEFWKREQQANATRNADISGLDYLHIPYENLPLMDTKDDNLLRLQKNILSLEDSFILNLIGLTNTDLKLLYGTANINFLSTCDSNFITLIKTLYEWGAELYNQGYVTEACQVLEYGISIKTDIAKHYILLGKIYQSLKAYEKIDDLILILSELNSSTKQSALSALNELKMSYYVD